MGELTHIDLFSGIGGFALACRWNGIKTVQFVEIDKFCQKVLNKNFPGVPIHDDIKTFANAGRERQTVSKEQATGIEQYNEKFWNDERYPNQYSTTTDTKSGKSGEQTESEGREDISGGNSEVFLLTGGFPCQPFSCAGKRKGTNDSRHLWPEMLRVIKTLKPKWIIGENVAGIINIKSMEQQDSESGMEGETFNDGSDGQPSTVLIGILNDLEQAGYSVQIFVIPACAVNAPHRRDRVWICAHSINGEHGAGRGQDGKEDGLQGINRPSLCAGGFERTNCHAPDTEAIHVEGCKRRQGQEQSGGSGWGVSWLEVATRLCRVDDGLSRKMDRVNRLKALGNSIVPQVAGQIIKAILNAEKI